MGISLGGLVAQCFAATEPAMVDRLVLCDTTPRYTDEARANWMVRAAAARRDGAASLLPMIEKIWFTPEFVAAEAPAVNWCATRSMPAAAKATRWHARHWVRPTCGAGSTHQGADAGGVRRRRKRCIQGRGALARQNIAGARLEFVTQAAHASVLEQPAVIERLLRSFLG